MIAHRMPSLKPLQFNMAAHTKFINRFIQLKEVATGMGVMTGNAATPLDNTVGEKTK